MTDKLKHITPTEVVILDAASNLLFEIAKRLMDASYSADGTEERRLIVTSCDADNAHEALASALISFRIRLADTPDPVEPQSLRA